MEMKTIRYLLLLIPLLLVACSPDDTIVPEAGKEGNITFTFTTESGAKTKTVLENSASTSDGKQHVSTVYLYVFDASGTCTRVDNVPWPDPSSVEVNYQTVSRIYSTTLPAGDYTFLAVGLDDASGTTYNLPDAITVGSSLTNATVMLATGKTKEDIATSELFAGSLKATLKESLNTPVTINLYRRVAGVMGWFTNIPADISKIQISLYTGQNEQGYLLKQAEGTEEPTGIKNPNNFKDYITSSGTSEQDKILVSINVSDGTVTDGVFSGGSFALPAAAPTKIEPNVDAYPDEDDPKVGTEYTLSVELIGVDGTTIKTQRAKMKEGDDLYIPELPELGEGSGASGIDLSGPYRFPIVANHFYSIGTKDVPVDLGGGDDIVITVNPMWEGISEDIPLE